MATMRRYPMLASALVHVLFGVAIFSVAAPDNVRKASHDFVPLFAPAPKPEPARMIPEAHHQYSFPRRMTAPIPTPQPLPEVPAPQLHLTPKPPHTLAEGPVIEAPQTHGTPPVTTGVFTPPNAPAAPSAGSSKPAVQTGTFSAGEGPTTPSPPTSRRPQIGGFEASRTATNQSKTSPPPVAPAGFGGPGVASRSSAAAPSPTVGAFGESLAVRAAGPRSAAPSAAGFGSPVAAVPQRPRQRETASSAFESVAVTVAPTAPARQDGTLEHYKPVEILQKPRPVYTVEARRLQIEGDVNLDAVFSSSGKVRVRRVLHGLGHGLDESATQAACAIQFRPASVNGSPIDVPAVVKITFQLAY
jgi:TonB family protein